MMMSYMNGATSTAATTYYNNNNHDDDSHDDDHDVLDGGGGYDGMGTEPRGIDGSIIEDRAILGKKEIWNLEQEIVASIVQVEPDPPIDTTLIADNPLFHLIQDDHHDVYSFSSKPELFGGVDVSFPSDPSLKSVAVYVIVDKRTMKVVYHDYEYFTLDVPYIPGYLAFREIRPLELLVHRQVERRPDMTPQAILVDGNGILHPRHAGIACFLGTRLNIPTIGIGKTLFYEGGWTRENLNASIDHFLINLAHIIQQDQQQHNLEQQHGAVAAAAAAAGHASSSSIAANLSRYRGLIMKKLQPTGGDGLTMSSSSLSSPTMAAVSGPPIVSSSAAFSTNGIDAGASFIPPPSYDRKEVLKALANYCNGVGIPLMDNNSTLSSTAGGHHQQPQDPRFPILGCALVGQGGQIAASARSQPVGGTSKPIFVSVGHRVSLHRAAQVTASLCLSRIPEPVRQADLLGRDLLRRQGQL